jgi:hypothetical protein
VCIEDETGQNHQISISPLGLKMFGLIKLNKKAQFGLGLFDCSSFICFRMCRLVFAKWNAHGEVETCITPTTVSSLEWGAQGQGFQK